MLAIFYGLLRTVLEQMPDEIFQLKFKDKSQAGLVKKALPTIEFYRSKGKQLRDIYSALCDINALSEGTSAPMAFASFRNLYYKHRTRPDIESKEKKEAVSKSKKIASSASVPKSKAKDKAASSPSVFKSKTKGKTVSASVPKSRIEDKIAAQSALFQNANMEDESEEHKEANRLLNEKLVAHQKLAETAWN